jgi:hypothetical protein
MWSVSHRRNLVSNKFNRVGVGLAKSKDGGWFLTQVFASPVPVFDAESAIVMALERTNRARAAAGLSPVVLMDGLRDQLSDAALEAATGDVNRATELGAEVARREFQVSSTILSYRLSGADRFEAKDRLLDASAKAVAIGIAEDEDSPHGAVGMVLVVLNHDPTRRNR